MRECIDLTFDSGDRPGLEGLIHESAEAPVLGGVLGDHALCDELDRFGQRNREPTSTRGVRAVAKETRILRELHAVLVPRQQMESDDADPRGADRCVLSDPLVVAVLVVDELAAREVQWELHVGRGGVLRCSGGGHEYLIPDLASEINRWPRSLGRGLALAADASEEPARGAVDLEGRAAEPFGADLALLGSSVNRDEAVAAVVTPAAGEAGRREPHRRGNRGESISSGGHGGRVRVAGRVSERGTRGPVLPAFAVCSA